MDSNASNVIKLDLRILDGASRQDLLTIIAELAKANEKLAEKIRELEQKLNQDSSNSHKPPSSDTPEQKEKQKEKEKTGADANGDGAAAESSKKGKKKRKRGGQPGHEGKTRELIPTEDVDEVHSIHPDTCEHCGCKDLKETDEEPRRHQIWDVVITPHITEHQLNSGRCEQCGKVTKAELPAGVPVSPFSPHLQAIVALLVGAYRISRRKTEQILDELFKVSVSLGGVSNIEGSVSEALREPFEEAKRHIEKQPFANADETSFRQENEKGWLWVAVTSMVTVFLLRLDRSMESAKALLGGFKGYLGTDRFGSYNWIDLLHRQLCWAHLKRDFTKLAESGGYATLVGEALLERTQRLFELWYRVRDGTLARSSFKTYASRLRVEIRTLLENGILCEDKKLSGMCRKILAMEIAMWTFLRIEGVEPTNNAAERALRHGVIWRKLCYGTQSVRGSRFVERVLTAVETCRQQGRSVLEFLVAACEAQVRNEPAPSLLPISPTP